MTKQLLLLANTLWTDYFENGVPAPMLGLHGKKEVLRHTRLALGAVLGGAGTNMTGKWQTVSPPLAEGGEHTAAPKKWTPHRGPPGCFKGWTVRLASGRP